LHKITATGEHPFLIKDLDYGFVWRNADCLNVGSLLVSHKNNDYFVQEIETINITEFEGKVYNFEVEDVNSYIADGIAVHNCQELCGTCVVKGNIPAVVYRNSWGDYLGSTNNKVQLESGREIELPEGCYLSRLEEIESELRQQDTFAVSEAVGFPLTDLSWFI
jgi:hypothetical protein